MPTPIGCAVCRSPIASPRSDAANQPSTTRPLAAFTDAAPNPATNSPAPNSTRPGSASDASSTAPVAVSPTAITTRSPYRSAAAPHAISASNSPSSGAATSRPASVSETPFVRCSSGIRNGNPYRKHDVVACAATPTARMSQRRMAGTLANGSCDLGIGSHMMSSRLGGSPRVDSGASLMFARARPQ